MRTDLARLKKKGAEPLHLHHARYMSENSDFEDQFIKEILIKVRFQEKAILLHLHYGRYMSEHSDFMDHFNSFY